MLGTIINPGLFANQLEFLFGLGLLGMFCPLIWFIIAILICIWVYRDAKSRGMSGGLWLIITILLGIIGLIIYLVVRKPRVGGA